MTINYTTLLGLAQPVTGTEQGTWGDTVNTEITALLEDAIADAATFSVTSGDVTLTSTAGQANQARMAILLVTGTPGVSRNIIAPSQSKWYIVKNSSDASVVLKGSATTGVTILAGTEALCFWNGSDFEIVGVNGPSSSTDNAVVRFDSTTGKVIQNSGVIIDDSNNVSGMGTLGVGAITTTGVFTATAGTVSAPAITTTGDTNTGIFFPAADTIAFTEGGVEAMRIDSSGNVGIGTSSPGNLLHVEKSFAGTIAKIKNNSGNTSADAGLEIETSTTAAKTLLVKNAGTDRFWVQGDGASYFSGNVGIGTTSPTAISTNYGTIDIRGFSGGGIRVGTSSTSGGLVYGNSGGLALQADGTTLPIIFFTNSAERMRIDSSGNVGIGTTAPQKKLVVSNAGASGIEFNPFLRDNTSDGSSILSYKRSTSAYVPLEIDASDIRFDTSSTERMRIDSSGNVGIGTTSPGTTLQVTANATVNQSLRYNLRLFDASSTAAGVGSGVSFGYKYDGTNYLDAAGINVLKENGTSGNYSSAMTFSTRVNGGNLTERMRIDSSGNVGIGTSSPSSYGKTVIALGNGSGSTLALQKDSGPSLAFYGTSFNNTGLIESVSASGAMIFYTGTSGVSERMRIDSSGNVGIGATPSAWDSSVFSGVIQNRSYFSIAPYNALPLNYLTNNAYYNGTNWIYLSSNPASQEVFDHTGNISWLTAASGTAGNTCTFTERARITSGGNLSVGTTSSLGRLGIQAATADNTNYGIYIQDSASAIMFYVRNDGVIVTGTKAASPYNNTTATAANMVVDSNGVLLRSTSSIKYKTQVENLDSSHADAILNFRPVWYRSLCNADNKDWSWYGLIAEEVAEVEPRLVHWGYSEEDYEVVETQEEVQKERTITGEDGVETYTETETKKNKQLKADAQLKPEGVQYDRLTVLLLDIVKRQDKRIEALEAEVAALKAK